MTAHPGSFCSPAGSTDSTASGTPMVCSISQPGTRARWRSADASTAASNLRRAERRRLLARAREAGVTVPRGLPDDQVRKLIDPPDPVPDAASADYRVLTAVRDLNTGDLVSLASVRDRLADLSRAEVDAALYRLDRARSIQLEPDPNRMGITAQAKEAAIPLGGEDMHLVAVPYAAR